MTKETYEETEDNFHRAIDLILDHKEEVGKAARLQFHVFSRTFY